MRGVKFTFLIFVVLGTMISSCSEDHSPKKRFTALASAETGIDFNNNLTETEELNYFTYPYLYMGGGVAIGDINNDGLSDLYFTGNMVANKLYLNKGGMQFEDITIEAGVAGDDRWYTGVTMADVNADGYLDLYVSVAGKDGNKENQLFLNQGDLTFKEEAKNFGLADEGNSVQSVFFDYDKDGDLDLYVANYPITSFLTSNFTYRFLIDQKKPDKSDKLYRNEGTTFVDVTKDAGLLNFGLSISATVADYNDDGWEDIYVSNDFSTPDYLYFNNGDGTFTDKLREVTKQTAFYGMGADAADFNNDGLTDLMQVDMAAQDNRRAKANMASMDPGLFWSTVNSGFHYQYMYNTLQLNRGNSPDGIPVFSNVAWIGGVSSTDWSWAPLLADFDNDGWKDLFVANGTRREINNKDYFKKLESKLAAMEGPELLKASQNIPTEAIANFVFRNEGGVSFENTSEKWGFDFKGFSNGASYADLDNDGDLDLVINNIDSAALIMENMTDRFDRNHFLRIELVGAEKNPTGIGAKVYLYSESGMQFQHISLSRGFQSSVEPILHFGLGAQEEVDSVVVEWIDGQTTLVLPKEVDQTISITKTDLRNIKAKVQDKPLFSKKADLLDSGFYHQENAFDDYYYQVLLPHQMSTFGPALAKGDINGDGLEDFYVGNGSGYLGRVYQQNSDGTLSLWQIMPADGAIYEDIAALFLDVDSDGDSDLYVVSGGNEWPEGDPNYQDRLYLNEGGKLIKSSDALPEIISSGGCVVPFDIDNDGDLDLFVGGRLSPRNYPYPGTSHLLINQSGNGKVVFEDQTEKWAPGLSSVGMVTDGIWNDFDEDGLKDLVLVGEWMPITVFRHTGTELVNATEEFGLDNSAGWWFSIDQADFDGDNDLDLVVGNLGLNYKYQASTEETFDVFVNDFDRNNSSDIVLGYYNQGTQFPVRGRQCSSQQIPAIQVAFKDYNTFANATLEDIYGQQSLENSLHYQVGSFASIYMENEGYGNYTRKELPELAQISPINDMIIDDFDQDGNLDLIIAGNLYASEVETPRSDAGIGLLMIGDGLGNFEPLNHQKSGILIDQDTKSLVLLTSGKAKYLVAANNQGPLQLFSINSDQTPK